MGRGCEVNVKDVNNNTALHYACIYGHVHIIRTLLSAKNIDVNLRNIEHKIPLQAAPNDYEINSIFDNFMKTRNQETIRKTSREKKSDSFFENKENKKKEFVGPNSFSIISLLGKGSFAEVYLAEKKNDKKLFAMKVLHKNQIKSRFFFNLNIKLKFFKETF